MQPPTTVWYWHCTVYQPSVDLPSKYRGGPLKNPYWLPTILHTHSIFLLCIYFLKYILTSFPDQSTLHHVGHAKRLPPMWRKFSVLAVKWAASGGVWLPAWRPRRWPFFSINHTYMRRPRAQHGLNALQPMGLWRHVVGTAWSVWKINTCRLQRTANTSAATRPKSK